MRICPFISHMISDDWADALTVDYPRTRKAPGNDPDDDIVVLGYDGDQAVGLKNEAPRAVADDETPQAHLLCLKEPCRFYMAETGGCQFDAILERAGSHENGRMSGGDGVVQRIEENLEKIWKFQTKSVTELVSTVGEAEKKQQETMAELKRQLERSAKAVRPADDEKRWQALEGRLAKVIESLETRDKGVTNLSKNISEVALGVDESVRSLKKTATRLQRRLDELESSLPERVEAAVSGASGPDLTGQLDPVLQRCEELAEMSRRLESELTRWRDDVNSRADETSRAQESRMDAIAGEQKELKEQMAAHEERWDETSATERRRDAKRLNNLGVSSFHAGDLDAARDHFREAVDCDPDFAESYNNLGLVYTELGEEKQATDAFRRAIDLNPELNAAYNNLGYIFYKRGDYDEAVEVYNEALGRNAATSSSYTNLGNAYYQQDKLEEARSAWEKALELNPSDERAASNLEKLDVESTETTT